MTAWLKHMLSDDGTLSKRLLGALLLVIGVGGFAAVIAIDLLDAGREGGIGPAQKAALVMCAGIAALGLTLLPLGRQPA